MFLIGPHTSGKTTLGQHASDRTNIKMMNFENFIKTNGLIGKDDETMVLTLIN